MRMLEIGAANKPSQMAYSSELEAYTAVDPNLAYDRWAFPVPGDHVLAKIEDCYPEELGQFDLVYGANVLSNRPSDAEKLRIATSASKFKAENGSVVLIENYAPKTSNLSEIAERLGGILLYSGQSSFHDIWQQHRLDTPKLFDTICIL